MKTSRIKSIIIIILAAANCFLLLLMLTQHRSLRLERQETASQLTALYAASGIAMERDLIPENLSLPLLSLTRSSTGEEAFAQALLGTVTHKEESSGIHTYTGGNGFCTFRADGSFTCTFDTVADPAGTLRELQRIYAFSPDTDLSQTTGPVTGMQQANDLGASLLNGSVQVTLESGVPLSALGTFLSLSEPIPLEGEQLSTATALLRFLDYRNASGIICTQVTGLSGGYLLQYSVSSAQQLMPALQIFTDEASYYVNLITGEIARL